MVINDQYDLGPVRKASRRAALLSFVGFMMIVLALGYSTYQLMSLDRELAPKRAEIAKLEAESRSLSASNVELKMQEQIFRAKLESERQEANRISQQLASLKAGIAQDPSLQITSQNQIYQIRATAKQKGAKCDDYIFGIFLDSPPDVLHGIAKVTYIFDHPSVKHPIQEVTDESTGFLHKWRGWGCFDNVGVKIFSKDGSQHSVDFDMCKSLGPVWDKSAKEVCE